MSNLHPIFEEALAPFKPKDFGISERLDAISARIREAEAFLQKQNVPFDFDWEGFGLEWFNAERRMRFTFNGIPFIETKASVRVDNHKRIPDFIEALRKEVEERMGK
jgi:hypothetical protein